MNLLESIHQISFFDEFGTEHVLLSIGDMVEDFMTGTVQKEIQVSGFLQADSQRTKDRGNLMVGFHFRKCVQFNSVVEALLAQAESESGIPKGGVAAQILIGSTVYVLPNASVSGHFSTTDNAILVSDYSLYSGQISLANVLTDEDGNIITTEDGVPILAL